MTSDAVKQKAAQVYAAALGIGSFLAYIHIYSP